MDLLDRVYVEELDGLRGQVVMRRDDGSERKMPPHPKRSAADSAATTIRLSISEHVARCAARGKAQSCIADLNDRVELTKPCDRKQWQVNLPLNNRPKICVKYSDKESTGMEWRSWMQRLFQEHCSSLQPLSEV